MYKELGEYSANLDEMILGMRALRKAIEERLASCKRMDKAKPRTPRKQPRPPKTVGPNLWWVGGVIPLDLFFPGSDPHKVEEGFG